MRPVDLRCEYLIDPLGIDVAVPRLSWRVESDRRGARQATYRIRSDGWDSGTVATSDTVDVPYGGPPLQSRQPVRWTVEVTDEVGNRSTSEPASWEMGLLEASDWTASWIGRPATWPSGEGVPTTLLRREFTLDSPVERARLYVTALGIYQARGNGERVGRDELTPGWTDYHHRLQYQVYDVTDLLVVGANALAVELADGWYAGHVGFLGREVYGRDPALLAQLVLDHGDGSVTTVVTDGSWQLATGGRRTDMLMGEDFDPRDQPLGWDAPAAALDDRWAAAAVVAGTSVPLIATAASPVRVVAEIEPVASTEMEPGRWVFDLGQNLSGWARLVTSGPAGTRLTLRFAEVLDGDGELYVENLRTARATDSYVLAGAGQERYEPVFTFHGFRFVEVAGLVTPPAAGTLTGIVCSSDLEGTGTFECSDDDVNRLQRNIEWGQRGNFLEVPTDCPQRDERLGWTGDAQVFGATAMFNADVAAFLGRWLRDVVAGQSDDGAFPVVAPRLVGPNPDEADGAPGWGDAGVILPWLLYERYADRRILAECFDAMAAWVEHIRRANPDLLWRHGRHGDMGDWLSIDADSPKDVLGTSYFAWSARLVARAATVLGLDRAGADHTLADAIAAAYRAAYVGADGRIEGDTQTIYALALRFGLLEPAPAREQAAARLVADIAARDWHLSTGFLGVAHLLPALTDAGHVDVAYRLLEQRTCPSWLHPVRHGATTIWERWDGWTEEAGFADPAMNSFNHYAFGAVGEWLYESVAGIRADPDRPGYEHIVLAPHPGGSLSWVRASYRSRRGVIDLAWARTGDELTVDVVVPPGADAELRLPADDDGPVEEGGRPVSEVAGVALRERSAGTALLDLEAGSYRFRTMLTHVTSHAYDQATAHGGRLG